MKKKKCSKCEEGKHLNRFCKKKDGVCGRYSICKKCDSKKQREYQRKNRHKLSITDKAYYENNKEKILKRQRQYNVNNKEKISTNKKRYFQENKEKIYNSRKKCQTNKYNLNKNIRTRIGQSLNGNKNGASWEVLVGYTLFDLIKHLQKQFKPGMTFENYGEWHIDHKIPISAFNFSDPKHEDFKRCWALKNLQPLWAIDNLKKGNRLKKPFQPRLAL